MLSLGHQHSWTIICIKPHRNTGCVETKTLAYHVLCTMGHIGVKCWPFLRINFTAAYKKHVKMQIDKFDLNIILSFLYRKTIEVWLTCVPCKGFTSLQKTLSSTYKVKIESILQSPPTSIQSPNCDKSLITQVIKDHRFVSTLTIH